MNAEIEDHITTRYEIKKRIGKGVNYIAPQNNCV